jgi:hypothetical protein
VSECVGDPILSKRRNSHLCPSCKVRRSLWRNIWRFFVILRLPSPIGQGPRAHNFIYIYMCQTLNVRLLVRLFNNRWRRVCRWRVCEIMCFSPPLFLFISSSVQFSPSPRPTIVRPKLPNLPPVHTYIQQTTTFHSQGSPPHPPHTRTHNKRPHFVVKDLTNCSPQAKVSLKSPEHPFYRHWLCWHVSSWLDDRGPLSYG